MAIKKIQMKPEGINDYLDTLHPETSADQVIANDGKTVEDKVKDLGGYAVASGTNTYIVTLTGIASLVEGTSFKVKFTNANTSASTLNINGLGAKAIVKGNGSALSSGNIKAGQICNLVYGGVNFQLLGEGGEYGTATASNVLSGKTIGTQAGLVSGTMVNQGAKTLTPGASSVAIPAGYHNGSGVVSAVSNLSAGNIKDGVNVGGVVGTSFPLPTYSASNLVSTISTSGAINGTLAQSGILTTYTTSACLISFDITSSSTINVSSSKEFYYLKVSGAIASTNANITGFGRIIIFNPSKSVLTLTGNSNNTMQAVYNYIS